MDKYNHIFTTQKTNKEKAKPTMIRCICIFFEAQTASPILFVCFCVSFSWFRRNQRAKLSSSNPKETLDLKFQDSISRSIWLELMIVYHKNTIYLTIKLAAAITCNVWLGFRPDSDVVRNTAVRRFTSRIFYPLDEI